MVADRPWDRGGRRAAGLSLLVHGMALVILAGRWMVSAAPIPAPAPTVDIVVVAAEPRAEPASAPPAAPRRAESPPKRTPAQPHASLQLKTMESPSHHRLAPPRPVVERAAPPPAAAPAAAENVAAKASESLPPAAAPPSSPAAAPPFSPGTGEGGGAHGEAQPSAAAISAYLALVRHRIQDALVYPPTARRFRLSGTVRVVFSIGADGAIPPDSIRAADSGTIAILRDGALDTIRRLGALPPPPHGAMAVEVPVEFSLVARY